MSIFSRKVEVVAVEEPSFESELSSIKSIFETAINKGKILMGKMQAKQDAIAQEIQALNAESANIAAVQRDTSKFVSNLEGLV